MNKHTKCLIFRKLTALLAVITLLVQVQAVFACNVTGNSGASEQCCCHQKNLTNPENTEPTCCEFSQIISLSPDQDEQTTRPINVELPNIMLLGVLVAILIDTTTVTNAPNTFITSANPLPGTNTYQITQRFRI